MSVTVNGLSDHTPTTQLRPWLPHTRPKVDTSHDVNKEVAKVQRQAGADTVSLQRIVQIGHRVARQQPRLHITMRDGEAEVHTVHEVVLKQQPTVGEVADQANEHGQESTSRR